jgi:alkyl hydroperoxide reductase subunit F
MDKIYDLIIIGAGPAGITAAVYAARKKMSAIILTGDIGGQAAWSGDIENYTGYQFITGPDLVAKFEEHIKRYGIPVKESEPALSLEKKGELVCVRTERGEYLAKTAIIASGKRSRELGAPGEKEFRNKGVTYCATCDGPIFEGKDVAVIGGGNSALDAALQLIKIASSVAIVNITDRLAGDEIMLEKVLASPKVRVYNSSKVTGIFGENFVKGMTIDEKGEKRTLNVRGVFVEAGLVPNSEFASGVEKNSRGEILVNCQSDTSIPGVFAAGDVTNVLEKQIIIAAGEGAKAALRAFGYLSQKRWKDDYEK